MHQSELNVLQGNTNSNLGTSIFSQGMLAWSAGGERSNVPLETMAEVTQNPKQGY